MNYCDEARSQGVEKINSVYDGLIADAGVIISNMKNKNLDPHKYYDAKNNEEIDLVQYAADLTETKKKSVNELNKMVDEQCVNSIEFLQTTVNYVVALYTRGISEVLPKHMTHIDVATILAGYPLGGDNSVFNKFRADLLNSVGINPGNDLYKPITNPLGFLRDMFGIG